MKKRHRNNYRKDGHALEQYNSSCGKLNRRIAASDLAIVQQGAPDGPDLVRCWLQRAPARSLPRLQKLPILILTAEASYHAPYDHCTVKYLDQAGVRATWIKLADAGIRGNGHMMMLEKNNLEIAGVMSKWLEKTLPK